MNLRQQFGGFGSLPVVVKNILIINVLFFLADFSLGNTFHIDLAQQLGFHNFTSPDFKPYQLVTYMFMHGGIGHIFFNMFAVWMFGRVLEEVWGGKRFLLYYFVTAMGAIVLQGIISYIDLSMAQGKIDNFMSYPAPDVFEQIYKTHFKGIFNKEYHNMVKGFISEYYANPGNSAIVEESKGILKEWFVLKRDMPTVGASGAVFGVLLAFGMLFPNTMLYVYFAIPIKAKYFVMIYGALELYLGIANNPGDNVAHFAHLGGMIFGFFMIKYWNKNRKTFY